MTQTLTIAEAADRSGLSIDTIRFYEKDGLIPPIARDGRGWRAFSGADLDWLTTLRHLQATGMPLAEMTAFARSAHGPDAETRPEQAKRRDILLRHAARLDKQRRDLDACAAYLAHKLDVYGKD